MSKYAHYLDSASSQYSSLDELKADFSHIVDSVFFKGPIDYEKALRECQEFIEHTHPMLIFKLDDQFVIVYP